MTTFTRDDIIRMGVQARLIKSVTTKTPPAEHPVTSVQLVHEDLVLDALERFAALVEAAEREACAQVCEGYGRHQITQHLAYAIRARGAAQSTTCPACRGVDAGPCAVELVCTFGEGCHRKASCTHVYAPHQPLPDGCATAKCMHCGHEPDTTT